MNKQLKRSDYADQREIKFASMVAASIDPSEAFTVVYHPPTSWSDARIKSSANRIMAKPAVAELIAFERRMAADNLDITPVDVMREWLDIATADPNELISYRRVACRYCHGEDHRYQWRDVDEWAAALARALDYNTANPDKQPQELPDDAGGFGYSGVALPVETCPQCDGEGHGDVAIADTRLLQGKARKLYAGVKVTKNGVEVLMRDQDAALANIAKSLGMFTEKVELSGPGGGPVPVATMQLPSDPIEAAKVYQAIMRAKPTNG